MSLRLGLLSTPGTSLPEADRGGAFTGEHGSWNRGMLNGYKVVRPLSTGILTAWPRTLSRVPEQRQSGAQPSMRADRPAKSMFCAGPALERPVRRIVSFKAGHSSMQTSYVENAENCEDLAQRALGPKRKRLERMAKGWRALAEMQDWLDGRMPPVGIWEEAYMGKQPHAEDP
jgi:hypothetical protein